MTGQSLMTRRDALPENTRYLDTGCNLHPSCLSCRFERCQFDEPGGSPGAARRARNAALLQAAHRDGLTVEALAMAFGLSRRTVFRVLRAGRWGTG